MGSLSVFFSLPLSLCLCPCLSVSLSLSLTLSHLARTDSAAHGATNDGLTIQFKNNYFTDM